MTTNTPEAWEEDRVDKLFDEIDAYCATHSIKSFRDRMKALLHTTKVELLREVMAIPRDDGRDILNGNPYLNDAFKEGYVRSNTHTKTRILSLASRHGITEEELNQKEV